MKICGACCKNLSRDDFSKKQWQQKQHQRRCKECIAANNPLQLERPSCWICLGEGPDDVGLPLRRECSCRGSSGHCHLKCVVKYAQAKTADDWQSTEQWVFCPNCEQQYGAHFSLDMAKEFVSYVEDKFPPLIFQRNPRHLAIHIIAHQVKIMVIRYRKDVDEMRRSAHFILSSMSRIKQVEPHPPSLLLDAEAYAHFCLGALSEYGGSNEDFESAIIHYENARDICQSMGDETNVAMFEGLAAKVKAEREGNYVDEEEEAYSLQTKLVLESLEQHDIENVAELWEEEEHGKQKCVLKYRERHEKYIEDYGGEDPVSVEYGVELVNSLKLAGHGIEAERLASDLLVTSSRVLGPHTKAQEWPKGLCITVKHGLLGTMAMAKMDSHPISFWIIMQLKTCTSSNDPSKELFRTSCSTKYKTIKVKKSSLIRAKCRHCLEHLSFAVDWRVS